MTRLNTTTVSMAVTPTVLSTLFSHYLNRTPLKQRPTAHLSYDEGLHLVRSFLDFASRHTVEELQAFTSQWVPSPQWVKLEAVKIPSPQLSRSAEIIQLELGEDGLLQIGGRQWWQWRLPGSSMEAEWIEMRSHANERKKSKEPGRRVMLYIHGGAYYFGSVDEHRYQMQRHARKLKARVFAPRYRLSPQFPFPCGLQDCLAAYLYLLEHQDPSTIIIAGDSAGGGMTLSLLCLLRNQGLPLPAGAILISPWVDLTHSFPSVADKAPMDYIPQCGFHHKPSRAWPPPNDDDVAALRKEIKGKNKGKLSNTEAAAVDTQRILDAETDAVKVDSADYLTLSIDGKVTTIKDQIQMYTTNSLLKHPLVSPAMQSTLGGLPPLLIMVGGGEILRDEQVFVAHKCANPQKYAASQNTLSPREKELLEKFPPTDVQLQVWDDMCHVGPTLSFTRPAKHMYRSVAQFGAWALARAQNTGIEIMDDDQISVISTSESETEGTENPSVGAPASNDTKDVPPGIVGRAGDPLPRFQNHMIRQQVSRHGVISALAEESELAGCSMDIDLVGVIKEPTAKKWLEKKSQWDTKFATARAKVHKKLIKELELGWQVVGPDERPPPAALAGRRPLGTSPADGARKKKRSLGLSMWSLWGSKHDEETIERENEADNQPESEEVVTDTGQAEDNGQGHDYLQPPMIPSESRSRSRRKTVVDEHQTDIVDENTPVAQLVSMRREKEAANSELLGPDYVHQTGVAGKRPFLDGIALPFSLNKEPETASMMTLDSAVTPMESNQRSPGQTEDSSAADEPSFSQSETQQVDTETMLAEESHIQSKYQQTTAPATRTII